MDGYFNRQFITQTEKDVIENKTRKAEDENAPLPISEYHSIIYDLLSRVTVFGHAPYDPKFGDDKVCKCGHVYHRHFDSYENMDPVGCKYCDCDKFE